MPKSTGIRISNIAYKHLCQMAKDDKRSPTTGEIEQLIEDEWKRRQTEKAIAATTVKAFKEFEERQNACAIIAP